MIKKYNKEVGFIYVNENNIDKGLKNNNVVFEQGFTREDSGVPPLTTSHQAIGKNLKNYKVYGKSRQSNLPEGYTEIEYIRGNDSGYVPTNIYLNGDDIVKIKFKTLSSNIAFCLFGSYKANESDNFSVYIQSTYNSFFRYGDVNYRQFKAEPNTIYEIEMCADYLKINEETYYPFTTQTFTTRYPIYIGHINSSSSPKLKGIIYDFEIVGKARLLSCTRNSDGQIGMYDVMNNTFYPASGTLTAGANVVPTQSKPIEIESVGDKSKNLFDEKSISFTTGVLDDNGNPTGSTYSHYTNNFYPVLPNTQYTISGTLQTSTSAYRIYFYDNSQNWLSRTSTIDTPPSTFTTPANCYYARIQVALGITLQTGDVQLEKGSTATSYEPYYDGYKIPIIVSDGTNSSTTNIYLDEPLRKIEDYADYIDFENQKVIRKIGKFILKGNEVWDYMLDNTYPEFYSYISGSYNLGSIGCYCTHFTGKTRNQLYAGQSGIACAGNYVRVTQDVTDVFNNDVTTFKNWLSTQYNNDTPVEIEYIRATELEESITLPTIPSIKGTTIYSVGTSITPSNMYIKYKGK